MLASSDGTNWLSWLGDVKPICFENELNYKISSYFSAAVSIGIGRSNADGRDGFSSNSDYLQGSINAFISPFRNNRRNDFKIGAGFTLFDESHSYVSSINYNPYFVSYTKDERFLTGFNIIVEDEYRLNSRFSVGGKLFLVGGIPIDEGAIMYGFMLKFGVAL
jgi:hypothetical protein